MLYRNGNDVLFHCYRFGRALLGAITASDASVLADNTADILDEIEHLMLADVHAETAAGALVDINDRSLVAGFSQ